MYIIRNKQTHKPHTTTLTFESYTEQEGNKGEFITRFNTSRQAKQFMRARAINNKQNEIVFMTTTEMEKL